MTIGAIIGDLVDKLDVANARCLSGDEMRAVLERIVRSTTDSASHLRHLAAKALHCGAQPASTAEALECVAAIVSASSGSIATAKRLLMDNTKYVLPRIYLHGTNGKIALEWQCTPEMEVLLIVDTNRYEYFKIVQDKMSVHREYVGYSGGAIEEPIAKHLPLNHKSS
jgi:hypothetical protein